MVISSLKYGTKNITRYNNQLITNINFNGSDYHFADRVFGTNSSALFPYQNITDTVQEPIYNYNIKGKTVGDASVGDPVSGGGGSLPAEYQQVEYIQTTRNEDDVLSSWQYLDTNVAVTDQTRIEYDFALLAYLPQVTTSGRQGTMIFGLQDSASLTSVLSTQIYNNSKIWRVRSFSTSGNAATPSSSYFVLDDRYKFIEDLKNKKFTVYSGDTVVTNATLKVTAGNTYTLDFLGNGSTSGKFPPQKLYGIKIYESEVLVHDYVPCYRKLDSKPGVYDTVTSTFKGTTITSGHEAILGPNTGSTVYRIPFMIYNPLQWQGLDMGSVTWTKTGNYWHTHVLPSVFPQVEVTENPPGYCSKFTVTQGPASALSAGEMCINDNNYPLPNILVYDDGTYQDAAEFKSVMSGVYLYTLRDDASGTIQTPQITNIDLDAPLRSQGDVYDELDYLSQTITRRVGTETVESVTLPQIQFQKADLTAVTVNTSVFPKYTTIEYWRQK